MSKNKSVVKEKTVSNLSTQLLSEYVASAMLDYGSETVEERAIPDFRDGLKPVHRMILLAMYRLGLDHKGKFKKAARTVGEVLGKYHPHGDCLRGDTLVPLLNGKIVTIKSLAEENAGARWILAYNTKTKQLEPAQAYNWCVGHVTKKMYRVHMTNGQVIECTGNHPFYVKGQGWIKAKNLINGNRLVGGSISEKQYSYTTVSFKGVDQACHRLVSKFTYGELEPDEVSHHKNENKKDNRPSNIEVLTRAEHADHHGDYSIGLDAGRKTMFGQKNSQMRKAIKRKNSALMREYNANLPVIKAFKAVDLLKERSLKVNAQTYENLRSEKVIYNLTKLETLASLGYSLERIVKEEKFVLDTTKAIGHTKKLRIIKAVEKQNIKNQQVNDDDVGMVQHSMHKAIAKVFRKLLKKVDSVDLTWKMFLETAIVQAGFSNAEKVIYCDKEKLQEYFAIKTIHELMESVAPQHFLCVQELEKVILDEEENFYDFTVDGLHNMIIMAPGTDQMTEKPFVVVHNTSCYQAMVGIAGTKTSDNKKWRTKNANVPLIEGFGNWGNFIDSAAAMRYTEARMSKLGDMLLLDPDGMAVMDTLKNFSEDEDVPVILPAKLPLILLNGTEGIAVGVSMSSPSFELKGVITLTKRALAGEEITFKECAKTLKFVTAYGGTVISPRKELIPIFKGKGSAEWLPEYEFHPEKKMMIITSACPGLMSETSIETLADKCTKIKGVSDFSNETGKFGVRYEISFQRGLDDYAQQEVVDKVVAQCLTKKEGYDLGITIRQTGGRAKFQRIDIPTMLKMWAEWRVGLELKIIERLKKICEDKILRQKLYLKAIDCLDIIVKALKLKKSEDPQAYLVKHMKITNEEAHIILEMKVRQLRSMERDIVTARIKELEKELAILVKDTKKPAKRCLAQLEADEPILLAELG